MNDVFAIYPKDESSSTSFLNRIHTFESSKLGNRWHCYKVHFSDEDHSNCIKQSQQYRFIIFMGHGGETHLHGSCAKYGEMKVDVRLVLRTNNSMKKRVSLMQIIYTRSMGRSFSVFHATQTGTLLRVLQEKL